MSRFRILIIPKCYRNTIVAFAVARLESDHVLFYSKYLFESSNCSYIPSPVVRSHCGPCPIIETFTWPFSNFTPIHLLSSNDAVFAKRITEIKMRINEYKYIGGEMLVPRGPCPCAVFFSGKCHRNSRPSLSVSLS